MAAVEEIEDDDYFSFEELALRWDAPIAKIVKLALTDRLKVIAQADWDYPGPKIIEIGAHTPVTAKEVAKIINAKEPFSITGYARETQNGILRGDECIITFYPGLGHLIINADEVKRFEDEQPKEKKANKVRDPETQAIKNEEAIKIKPRNKQRDTVAIILLHAALDEMEVKNSKTPSHNELAAFVLGGDFKHETVQESLNAEEGSLIDNRKLLLTDGAICAVL